MAVWIALFRGINVGGNRILPMKELTALLEKLGHSDVRTYIQSGNAVFRSGRKNAAEIARQIGAAVEKAKGFEPHVLVLSVADLARAILANPFPKAVTDHKSLHLFFLVSSPKKPNIAALNALKTTGESFAIVGKVFYLHTPDGFGKSKLATRVEALLGVEATARNWRTVLAVDDITKRLS